MKQCSRCLKWKSLTEFHKNKSRKDGLDIYCKECAIEKVVNWRKTHPETVNRMNKEWRLANPEKLRESAHKSYLNNIDKHRERGRMWAMANPEKSRAIKKKWSDTNPDKVAAKNRKWVQSNLSRVREVIKAWWKSNPDKRTEYNHARRTLVKGNGGKFTAREWAELKASCNFMCLNCGRKEPEIKLTPDHVLPIDRGGTSNIDNIQPLCKSCNSSKGTKYIDYRPRFDNLYRQKG